MRAYYAVRKEEFREQQVKPYFIAYSIGVFRHYHSKSWCGYHSMDQIPPI